MLIARLSGVFDMVDVQTALEQLPSRLQAANADTAFIDLTGVDAFPMATQRHKLGIHAAKAWPRWVRVALVVKAEWMRKMFSNTARAHELGRTREWVVIYYERDGHEGQCTVVTEMRGPLSGCRVVRGREDELVSLVG